MDQGIASGVSARNPDFRRLLELMAARVGREGTEMR